MAGSGFVKNKQFDFITEVLFNKLHLTYLNKQ